MQRPRNPCRGLRTACDRRTRSEQLHGRGAAGPRAGDSREDRFEKSAFLVEHEQWRYCSIPAYARDQHQQPRAARLPTISDVRYFAECWGARATFMGRFSPPCDQRWSDELVLNKLAGSTYNTTPDSDLQSVQVQSYRVLSIIQENL